MLKRLLKKIKRKIFPPTPPNSPYHVEVVFFGDKSLVKIDGNVSFGGNVLLYATAPIEIGEHTMIGINTVLHTVTHDYHNHPMWLERIDKPIKIGKHVWIGTGVLITGGVIVGDYSVIGAGSVVVENVPSFAIVAGNPARIIKYRQVDTNKLEENYTYPFGSYISKGGYTDKYCKEKNN